MAKKAGALPPLSRAEIEARAQTAPSDLARLYPPAPPDDRIAP